MKTEMTTTGNNPVSASWIPEDQLLITNYDRSQYNTVYTTSEAIELRDFLIQLNLGK